MVFTNLYVGYNEVEDFRILICASDDIEALSVANEYLEDSKMLGSFVIFPYEDEINGFKFDCDYVIKR